MHPLLNDTFQRSRTYSITSLERTQSHTVVYVFIGSTVNAFETLSFLSDINYLITELSPLEEDHCILYILYLLHGSKLSRLLLGLRLALVLQGIFCPLQPTDAILKFAELGLQILNC